MRNAVLFSVLMLLPLNTFAASPLELMNEGRMKLYRGDIAEGISVLEEARRLDSGNLYIKYNLAKGYSWDNRWDRALKLYSEIVAASGPAEQVYWDARFGIAQITSWEKKYDEALQMYYEILRLYKNAPKGFKLDINLAIGDILSWKTDYDESVRHFKALLKEDPDNPVILNRISKIYLWGGEYSISREFTERALKLDPDDSASLERKRVLDQIKPFTVMAGYDYTWYDVSNSGGNNVQVQRAVQGLTWQYSTPLRFFAFADEVFQNTNDVEQDGSYYDVSCALGAAYRINPLTYLSGRTDFSAKAEIYPRFSGEMTLTRKVTSNIDLMGTYKYTYDRLHDAQELDDKHYHLLSPGIVFYYSRFIYNRIQFYVETDTRDLFYSVMLNQYLALNPENIIQFYLFLSQGRSYLVYSDSTVFRETTTYSASIAYTHFFNSSVGIEFTPGITASVGNYSNYHAGINFILKW